jgi:hypothetical protein
MLGMQGQFYPDKDKQLIYQLIIRLKDKMNSKESKVKVDT